MSFDLWPLLLPVLLAAIISIATAWAVRKYAGPAQAAYVAALEGRIKVLQADREDLSKEVAEIEADMATLKVRVAALQDKVIDLERQVRVLTAENLIYLRAEQAATTIAAAAAAAAAAAGVAKK